MNEEDEIEQASQLSPLAIRLVVEVARDSKDESERRDAIAMLVARGFLVTDTPDDGDLARIMAMTAQEIIAILKHSML